MERIMWFLLVFSIVMFLEAIGQSYMVTAIQSMERQFQIPSKVSGFMVSASDIGYIPTVIFISYFGSKGNRARWIAVGALMTAFAFLLISSPNFLFPVHKLELNLTSIQDALVPPKKLLQPNATIADFINYAPINNQISTTLKQKILEYFSSQENIKKFKRDLESYHSSSMEVTALSNLYSIDETIAIQIVEEMNAILEKRGDTQKLESLLVMFVQNRAVQNEADITAMRRSATAPFSFCNRLINDLRQLIQDETCELKPSNMGPFILILIALILLGVGRTMPWSLGLPMIDDNVKRKNLPTYFAGLSFIRILGPITGFLIGSFSNQLYYTLKPPLGLTAKDPTWIGAWWLGFLVIGLLAFGPSIFLYYFPASKNGSVKPENDIGNVARFKEPKKSQVLSFYDKHVIHDDRDTTLIEKLKAFRGSYGEVLTSKVYVGAVFGRVLDMLAFRGYTTFLPKYLENHYGLPQYKAHQLMAMFGVFGFALGTLTGGYIVRRFKLNGRRAAVYFFLLSVVNVSIFFSKSFIGCNSIVNTVGINGRKTNMNFTTTCNANCGCENAPLFPICGADGIPYYSPCHAGCRQVRVQDISTYKLEFFNCDCSPGSVLKKENCRDDCTYMTIAFFAAVMCGAFIAGCGLVTGMLILIRSVPPARRTISLGLQGFLISLFATLPSPLFWGFIYDSACLVWNHTCSGEIGTCAIYEPNLLRKRVHLIYSGLRTITLITDLYVIYHAKNLNLLDDEEKKPSTPRTEPYENIPM